MDRAFDNWYTYGTHLAIAGLLSFIPNFGPIIAAVPAVLFAFIESPMSAVYTLALYIGVQIIEEIL